MKAADLRGIFEPVINKIIDLVKNQIEATEKKIRAVLLVGGFGQNNYLKESLRTALGSSVDILQPTNAWTAVVRGAVMMGLANANKQLSTVNVVSRAARKFYGIELNSIFDARRHDESKMYVISCTSTRVLC